MKDGSDNDKTTTGVFQKAALTIYAPDAASQVAANAVKTLIEAEGGTVTVLQQNPPYNGPGYH